LLKFLRSKDLTGLKEKDVSTGAFVKESVLPSSRDEKAIVNFIAVYIYRRSSNATLLDFIFSKIVFNGAFAILLN
jgi:hypothetical protein